MCYCCFIVANADAVVRILVIVGICVDGVALIIDVDFAPAVDAIVADVIDVTSVAGRKGIRCAC